MATDDDAQVFNLNTRKGRRAARGARRARNLAAARERAAIREAARYNRKAPFLCKATSKTGYPCKARATTEDGYCRVHSATEEERKVLMAQARAVRNQRHAKPHELMRMVVESNPIAFMQPYLDALGIRVVFVPDPADPSIMHPTAVADPSSHGTTLFGVSKDGHVIVSKHKDIEAQQRAAERLFDRVYGKPKQTNIIAGADNQSELNIVPFDDKRQQEIAAILEAAKKPSHAELTPEQLN